MQALRLPLEFDLLFDKCYEMMIGELQAGTTKVRSMYYQSLSKKHTT